MDIEGNYNTTMQFNQSEKKTMTLKSQSAHRKPSTTASKVPSFIIQVKALTHNRVPCFKAILTGRLKNMETIIEQPEGMTNAFKKAEIASRIPIKTWRPSFKENPQIKRSLEFSAETEYPGAIKMMKIEAIN